MNSRGRPGPAMPFHEEQATRIDTAGLQSFLTWGDQQSMANIVSTAPGQIYVLPVGSTGLPPFPNPPSTGLVQLVDARFQRPTTWTVALYVEAQSDMPTGDGFQVVWSVQTNVGKAFNEQVIQQAYVSPGTISPPRPRSVLTTLQLPGQMVQVIPKLVSYNFTSAGTTQSLLKWSASVAPVFM